MSRNGLTITIVFLAESANYGEGVGNISTLKKMTRGNYEQYSYISRQALRYNMIQQLGWDTTPVDGKSGVVQFAPSASIVNYPEIDLFGYMKTSSKEDDKKGGAMTRSAVVRLSNAVALVYPSLGRYEDLLDIQSVREVTLSEDEQVETLNDIYMPVSSEIDDLGTIYTLTKEYEITKQGLRRWKKEGGKIKVYHMAKGTVFEDVCVDELGAVVALA